MKSIRKLKNITSLLLINNKIIDQIRVYHDDGSYDIIMQ